MTADRAELAKRLNDSFRDSLDFVIANARVSVRDRHTAAAARQILFGDEPKA